MDKDDIDPTTPNAITFREAFRTWARIAALSFGGPAGQIAVMHRILVDEKHWIGETRFLHALNYCMLLPGPEAHELAIYIGWLLHRIRGGILAGMLFVLPGIVVLGTLSWIYAAFGHIGTVQGLFFGLKCAVLAIVLEAMIRVSKRALKSPALIIIAVLAFIGIFFFALPFPAIILGAALAGYVGTRFNLDWFKPAARSESGEEDSTALIDRAFAREIPAHVRPSFARFALVALIGGAIWLGPLALCFVILGPANVFTAIAGFNAKMAIVTFGGAYAILAYMAQEAVQHYHWLNPGEMLVGLGFAETTPGPLICVVQFVGFMAAFRAPGALSPAFAGTIGGLLAAWSTFVPPFIWIFLGGPYVEALIGNRALNGALSAITAAVVGVIANLAIWLALHTLFGHVAEVHAFGLSVSVPALRTISLSAVFISLAAVIAIFRFKIGMLPVLAAASAIGMIYYLTGGHA
ncbi:MAG TPA: chromate efflux transporter [Rhizomicrobium sp.]|jgi:chromate transporter